MSEEATKTCPYCAETIKAAAVVCRFCERDLVEKAAPAVQQKRGMHPLLVIGLGVLVIFGAFYWFISTGPAIEGQRGRIVGSGPSALAASDSATFNQLGSVSVAQLAEWQQAGRVALLPIGTQVLVLSVDVPRSKVRVLGGEFAGKEFYVQTTAVGR